MINYYEAVINGILSTTVSSICFPFGYVKGIDLCMLILYPATQQNFLAFDRA